MGRQKEFDTNATIEKAMKIFWKTGYEGTSLQTLLKGLDLLNGSFYHSFKSKKKLYLAALETYNQDFSQKRILVFSSSHPFKKKLLYFFDKIFDRQQKGECPKGCFLFNSVHTDAMRDKDLKHRIQLYIGEFEQFLEQEICKAVQNAELSSKTEARRAAKLLVTHMAGLMQMSTLHYDDKVFREQTKAFVELLFSDS